MVGPKKERESLYYKCSVKHGSSRNREQTSPEVLLSLPFTDISVAPVCNPKQASVGPTSQELSVFSLLSSSPFLQDFFRTLLPPPPLSDTKRLET